MINFILTTEGAAAFDDLTRSKDINDPSLGNLAQRIPHPPVRAGRRIHSRAARPHAADPRDGRADVASTTCSSRRPAARAWDLTNLTGHPAVALKAGFVANAPVEIMVTGRLYDEATTLRVALAYERATKWHTMNPSL